MKPTTKQHYSFTLITPLALTLCFFVVLGVETAQGQTQNVDYNRLKLLSPNNMYSGIAISPDGKTLAVAARKKQPVRLIDVNTWEIVGEIDAGSGNQGAKLNFSSKGNYLILQEQRWNDVPENKPRKIDFELVDVVGKLLIKRFDLVQDVVVSEDESLVVSLAGDEVTFWQLPDLRRVKSFIVPNAASAIALSPDGKTLAVAQRISPDELKGQPNFKKKKARKFVAQSKQKLSFFDVESGKRLKTVNNFYDLIYRLRYLDDENLMFVFQQPYFKAQTSLQLIVYINMVNTENGEALRGGFTSQAYGLPEVRMSPDKAYFAINSKGNRFQEIHLYDYQSGRLLKRFELAKRFFEKSQDGTKLFDDARPSFVFMPDNSSILIAMGNQFILWNFLEDE